jgi:hypothetical protein
MGCDEEDEDIPGKISYSRTSNLEGTMTVHQDIEKTLVPYHKSHNKKASNVQNTPGVSQKTKGKKNEHFNSRCFYCLKLQCAKSIIPLYKQNQK